MLKQVPYTVTLQTIFDLENMSDSNRNSLLKLDEQSLIALCVGALTSVLDDVNKGNTWAKVELVGVSN